MASCRVDCNMCGSAICICFICCLQEAREHYRKIAKELFGHAAYLELLMASVVACCVLGTIATLPRVCLLV